ncbi:MAG TPA: tRNA1(Val) (adenine(37)-N6)-methyltransferase [Bacillota bacterium]|nr:tRNA1(Val) (adenine(37)-N6)-methyltransferase [Bacillota bacterium]
MQEQPHSMLLAGERLDQLSRTELSIIQHPGRFCFGMDAVLLSSLASLKAGESVCDFGTGTGVIPLLLSSRFSDLQITGLEIQSSMADMANRSVLLNNLQDHITILQGDFRAAATLAGKRKFDLVISNPPYKALKDGLINPSSAQAIARHELFGDLDDLLQSAAAVLKPLGRFALVYRPQRLVALLSGMAAVGIEPKRLRLIQSKIDRKPNLVFVEGVLGGKPELIVEPSLVIYGEDGAYTKELLERYHGGDKGNDPLLTAAGIDGIP